MTGLPLFEPLARDCQALAAAPPEPRQQNILYSPKGSDFTALPRQRAPDLDRVEPSGFTSQEMRELFWTAMLYVGFGTIRARTVAARGRRAWLLHHHRTAQIDWQRPGRAAPASIQISGQAVVHTLDAVDDPLPAGGV